MSKQAIFNGHTWIIMLTAIIILGLMGIGSIAGLFYLLTTTSVSVLTGFEVVGIPSIPYIVVKGIIILAEVMVGKKPTETLDKKEE